MHVDWVDTWLRSLLLRLSLIPQDGWQEEDARGEDAPGSYDDDDDEGNRYIGSTWRAMWTKQEKARPTLMMAMAAAGSGGPKGRYELAPGVQL